MPIRPDEPAKPLFLLLYIALGAYAKDWVYIPAIFAAMYTQ